MNEWIDDIKLIVSRGGELGYAKQQVRELNYPVELLNGGIGSNGNPWLLVRKVYYPVKDDYLPPSDPVDTGDPADDPEKKSEE